MIDFMTKVQRKANIGGIERGGAVSEALFWGFDIGSREEIELTCRNGLPDPLN